MRMDRDQELTAERVVNTYPAADLIRILRDYGEERFAARVANLIVKERAKDPITSTKRLADLVRAAIPAATRRTGGNPAKRTFQALRIEVNGELTALERALPAALGALALGGRVVVLAYHSLEDRLTKRVLVARTKETGPPGLPVPLEAHQPRFRLLTRERSSRTTKRWPATRGRPRPACGRQRGSARDEDRAGEQEGGRTRGHAVPRARSRAGPGRRIGGRDRRDSRKAPRRRAPPA